MTSLTLSFWAMKMASPTLCKPMCMIVNVMVRRLAGKFGFDSLGLGSEPEDLRDILDGMCRRR